MPLERGVAPTGAAPPSQTPAKEQAVPPLKSFKELSPTRAERLNWSVLVLLTAIAALGVHEALNRCAGGAPSQSCFNELLYLWLPPPPDD